MKKKTIRIIGICVAIIVLCLILITAYIERKNSVVNDYKNVSMYIKDASLSASGLTLSINNGSSNEIVFDDKYDIEKEVDNAWYQLPYQSLAGTKLQGSSVTVDAKTYGEKDIKLDWTKTYGMLDPGAYRLTKSFTTSDGKSYNLAVTFEIKNS